MNKCMIAAIAGLAAFGAGAVTLAEANANIAETSQNAAAMGETIKGLPAENQAQYLGQVNAAIAAMNESAEKKAAMFIDANKAALANASEESKLAVLAETFATVPPEVLAILSDIYAKELFAKDADPENPVSKEAFAANAEKVMEAVDRRVSSVSDGGARAGFAAIMLAKAAGDTAPELIDSLVSKISDSEAATLAKEQWIPAALGKDGADGSFDPILGASDSSEELPDVKRTLALADTSPMSGAFFANLADNGKESRDVLIFNTTELAPEEWALPESLIKTGLNAMPRTADPDDPWYGGYRRGSGTKGSNNAGGESGGYAYQSTY